MQTHSPKTDSYTSKGGLKEDFHAQLVKYVEDKFSEKHLKEFARGDKQQALYEFLEPEHYDELRELVAAVAGVEPSSLTLSERHIKEYEPGADPYPLAPQGPVRV